MELSRTFQIKKVAKLKKQSHTRKTQQIVVYQAFKIIIDDKSNKLIGAKDKKLITR